MPFTVDMNKCPSCPYKVECSNRKKIVSTLSQLAMELNSGDQVEGPGDGIIIVHCQYNGE